MTIHCRKQILILWSVSFCGRWDNLSGPQPVPIAFFPGYSSGAVRNGPCVRWIVLAAAFADAPWLLSRHTRVVSGMWQANDPRAKRCLGAAAIAGSAHPSGVQPALLPLPKPRSGTKAARCGPKDSAAVAAARSLQPCLLGQLRSGEGSQCGRGAWAGAPAATVARGAACPAGNHTPLCVCAEFWLESLQVETSIHCTSRWGWVSHR